jgi:hypothetical protein
VNGEGQGFGKEGPKGNREEKIEVAGMGGTAKGRRGKRVEQEKRAGRKGMCREKISF